MNNFRRISYLIASLSISLSTIPVFGMDIFEAATSGNTARVAELIQANKSVINKKDRSGWSPLHYAACNGRTDIVRLLLTAGADVNESERGGMVPLHCAAFFGHANVAQVLIAWNGAKVNKKDQHDRTPLQIAIRRKNQEVMALLTYYERRFKQIKTVLAAVTHHRLGAESPMSLLPQFLLREIAHMVTSTEEVDVRQQQELQRGGWCAIL